MEMIMGNPIISQMPKKTDKIQDFLRDNNINSSVRVLPSSTRTAIEAAQAIGCQVAQIAKSIVFQDQDSLEPVLVVTKGTNRVDVQKIQNLTNLQLKQADGKWIKKTLGFAIGGVPPVGFNIPVTVFIDEDLLLIDEIWAAAGTPNAVFCLTPTQLLALSQGAVLPLAQESN